MDRLDRLHLFARLVERRSFSAAARDCGVARSTATEEIKRLERDLGTRLLDRSTRHAAPTLDGEAFYARCLTILAEVEEAEQLFREENPRGLLRVDAHGLLTRTFLLPRLGEFLARYPLLDLQIGQGDRMVDLIREGVDCVIRAGTLPDSDMIARHLGTISEVTCASPAYLEERGRPDNLADLEGQHCVGFLSSRTGVVLPLEFVIGGETRLVRLPSRVTVNSSDTMAELARLGFGIIQAPRYRLRRDLEEGRLVEILAAFPPSPTPLSALYPQSRQTSPRLRVFLAWIAGIFAAAAL
ncbi:MAG TPA: LysR family transcriptional regulator [Acidisoma sp.]|jgi:DNA-binding transcriptional LysR family regulator|nr:LysR family transcriptional regulator [Acidisoma sp.]